MAYNKWFKTTKTGHRLYIVLTGYICRVLDGDINGLIRYSLGRQNTKLDVFTHGVTVEGIKADLAAHGLENAWQEYAETARGMVTAESFITETLKNRFDHWFNFRDKSKNVGGTQWRAGLNEWPGSKDPFKPLLDDSAAFTPQVFTVHRKGARRSDQMITRKRAARVLGISTTNVLNLAKQGKIPEYRPSPRRVTYKLSEVLLYRDGAARPAIIPA